MELLGFLISKRFWFECNGGNRRSERKQVPHYQGKLPEFGPQGGCVCPVLFVVGSIGFNAMTILCCGSGSMMIAADLGAPSGGSTKTNVSQSGKIL
jgi:hypothetical protein